MEDVTRDVHEGIGPDGIDLRLYTGSGRPKLPSVTTVLKTRDDDKSNLHDWQDRNDGTGDAADYNHLFWYSRHLGTLGHWHALSQLDDTLEWTGDEEQSARELRRRMADEVENDSPREILYSIMRGDKDKAGGRVSTWGEFYDEFPPYKSTDYYASHIPAQVMDDVAFFRRAQQRLWDGLVDEVVAVEQFLHDDDLGYAGQVDLVYRDPQGYNVVADLKSSSGCYDKHQLQGAAYARAVENSDDVAMSSVDRIEVHRANPRTGQAVVHSHRNAPGLTQRHVTKWWTDGIDALYDQFEDLISNLDGYYENA